MNGVPELMGWLKRPIPDIDKPKGSPTEPLKVPQFDGCGYGSDIFRCVTGPSVKDFCVYCGKLDLSHLHHISHFSK